MRLFGYKLEHILSPVRWKMAIKDKILKTFEARPGKVEDAIWESEVITYRAKQCPQCVEAGKCIGNGEPDSGCKCPVPSLFLGMEADCDLGNWNAVKDEEDWESQKLEEAFIIDVRRY